jgi:hypothetical protein
MGLLSKLFKAPAAKPAPAPATPAPPPPVPAHLPKLTSPTAAQLAQSSHPSPAAQALLTPQQTPAQHLQLMQEHHLGGDMVKTLAHGLPDREGVHWAAKSAEQVSDKLPPHELQGMKAAQAWSQNPTPENQAAAAAAASHGGCRGPGSMAAQGAAWAQPSAPAAPGAAAAPRLTPHAVTGAVLMSAGIKARPATTIPAMAAPTAQAPAPAAPTLAHAAQPPAPQAPAVVPPELQAQTFQQQHPFIKMGLDIASGKG